MKYRSAPRMLARKAARRRSFLEVATRRFGDKGYHRTSVPEVVAATGSSTGCFYSYFENKEDLFAQVLRQVGERLSAELNEAIERESEPVAQMRAAVEGLFVFLAQNPAQARILVVESSGLGPRLEAERRSILASHARSVERALRALPSPVAGDDPRVLARCWVGAVYEAVRFWLELKPKQRPSALRMAGQVARFNLRGIAAPS